MTPTSEDWETVREGIVHEISGDSGLEWCFSCHAALGECSGSAASESLTRLQATMKDLEAEIERLKSA